jgi:hypothetical protein
MVEIIRRILFWYMWKLDEIQISVFINLLLEHSHNLILTHIYDSFHVTAERLSIVTETVWPTNTYYVTTYRKKKNATPWSQWIHLTLKRGLTYSAKNYFWYKFTNSTEQKSFWELYETYRKLRFKLSGWWGRIWMVPHLVHTHMHTCNS